MQRDDDSWIITTEVTLESQPRWRQDPPVRVQVITLPLEVALDSDGLHPWAEYESPDTLRLPGDDELRLNHLDYRFKNTEFYKHALLFIDSSLEIGRRYPWRDSINRSLLELPVPVLGTRPHDWQSLSALVSSGGAGVATTVAAIEGSNAPATFIISFATMIVLIDMVSPAARALGRGAAFRIDQFCGTPPEAPPKDRTPAPVE